MALWALLFAVFFFPGWFVIGLAGGEGCTDCAPWVRPAQQVWGIIAAALAALGAALTL